MRFHYVAPERSVVAALNRDASTSVDKHLWAWTSLDAAAEACLLSLKAPMVGHEVFYIVSPTTTSVTPSMELAARHFPDVPITGDLSGQRSFFSSAKAERLLGWDHDAATPL
jgi:nucleoside-diphosphate-sugar epimerase